MYLRLAQTSGKTMKTSVYKAVAVYCQDRDDVTLEDVSSTQPHEENPMFHERVKKYHVLKEDARSAFSVLKLATST